MVRRFPLAAMAALLGAGLSASTAHAATALSALPMAVVALAGQGAAACPAGSEAALAPAGPAALIAPASKVQALLGGHVSQLDLIRRQQAGAAALASQPLAAMAIPAIPAVPALEPAAGPGLGAISLHMPCAAAFSAAVQPLGGLSGAVQQPLAASPENFLASKRIEIRHTGFDREWDRVERSGLSGSMVGRLLGGAASGSETAALERVNSWANARIRYVEDRELYGRADYWAKASETLRRGAGDCEDIAIAKMQMLAALGVGRQDMYLTIARDLVRGADHAVLIVKVQDKSWLLDNSTDTLLDASTSHDYRPVFSFSRDHKWIHGY